MRALEVELADRRAVVGREPVLTRLADWLAVHVETLAHGEIYFPTQKALLSKDGGVCPSDGARLRFDPRSPYEHHCPKCGGAFTGERHHRAWIMRYQIWLSERALHLALLAALTARDRFADRAAEILDGYARRYRTYPNRDNVLGPTRLFFSTYLESIWLIQLTTACAVLECGPRQVLSPPQWEAVRAMVRESAGLVVEFDEGWSNRQVWNNAALVAAGSWLEDRKLVATAVDGPHGLRRQLALVGPNGFWPEGENYHFFALRGFLVAAEWIRWMGGSLYHGTRLGAMYTAPLLTLLPDLTLPARGDSPYAVSVRQRRFAELWEIGRVRTTDRRLDAVLADLYDADGPDPPTEDGLAELAEQEQNEHARRQARDRLGWKALLWMNPAAPRPGTWSPEAVTVLDDLGVVVLRPEGWSVGIEMRGRGAAAAGHGHPDALHLSVHNGVPLLADFGTGSYVSDSLFWYRSTLAHNAPGVAGQGQYHGRVWCAAADAGGPWTWCKVHALDILGPGTLVARTVVAGDGLVVDIVDVEVPAPVAVDLPVHPFGVAAEHLDVTTAPAQFTAGADASAVIQLAPRADEAMRTGMGPGPPSLHLADGEPTPFLIRRAAGTGRWVMVISGRDRVPGRIECEDQTVRLTVGADTLRIAGTRDGVTVSGLTAETVELRGTRLPPPAPLAPRRRPPPRIDVPIAATPPDLAQGWKNAPCIALGAEHYRRSEEPYDRRFSATVGLQVHSNAVVFLVDVTKPRVVVRSGDAADPALDNEVADIHSDGVQCYIGRERDEWEGYLIVPAFGSGEARVHGVRGTTGDSARVAVTSQRRADGYRVVVRCATARPFQRGDRFRFSIVVNEQRPERERRSGQLALGGGGWVYLRGDRESPSRAWEGHVV